MKDNRGIDRLHELIRGYLNRVDWWELGWNQFGAFEDERLAKENFREKHWRGESYDLKENGEKGKDGFGRDFREYSKEYLSDSISNENIFILFRFRD